MIDLLQKELEKYINDNILDIIIFGSVARRKENPKDIDIAVLFKEFDESIYLKLSKVYHVIPIINCDIFSLGSIFIEILAEGWSVKYKNYLKDILGYKVYKEIIFNKIIYLENANSGRTSLHYFLYGRKDRNKIGLLKETNSIVIRTNPLIIRVPIENSEIFKKKLEIFSKLKNIYIETIESTVIIGKTGINYFNIHPNK